MTRSLVFHSVHYACKQIINEIELCKKEFKEADLDQSRQYIAYMLGVILNC